MFGAIFSPVRNFHDGISTFYKNFYNRGNLIIVLQNIFLQYAAVCLIFIQNKTDSNAPIKGVTTITESS